MQRATVTMRDKLRATMAESRTANARNANSFGNAEEGTLTHHLLAVFLLELDESEETLPKKWDGTIAREEALFAAGEEIQRNELSRRLFVDDEGNESTRSTHKKRRLAEDMTEYKSTLEKELAHK